VRGVISIHRIVDETSAKDSGSGGSAT